MFKFFDNYTHALTHKHLLKNTHILIDDLFHHILMYNFENGIAGKSGNRYIGHRSIFKYIFRTRTMYYIREYIKRRYYT